MSDALPARSPRAKPVGVSAGGALPGRPSDYDAVAPAASIHPEQPEAWFDGVDQNCTGVPAAASSTYRSSSNALQLSDFDHSTKPRARSAGDGQRCDPASSFNACDHLEGGNAGLDCDDGGDAQAPVLSEEIFPAAGDPPYDDVDQDCDGSTSARRRRVLRESRARSAYDWDWDQDGYVSDVAHVGDALCHWWDGSVAPCAARDCNDGDYWDGDEGAEYTTGGARIAAQSIHPGPPDEDWYNGVDEDCSPIPGGASYAGDDERALSDYDKDQDGYVCKTGTQYNGACPSWGFTVAGTDCADDPSVEQTSQLTALVIPAAEINPEADEVWYDGVDQDCVVGRSDFDKDGDQALCDYDSTASKCKTTKLWKEEWATTPPTFDCNDTTTAIAPGLTETWYDGTDTNCDGWNDWDADEDTYVHEDWNGKAKGSSTQVGDCEDAVDRATDDGGLVLASAIHPGAAEAWYDGVDQDCGGAPVSNQYGSDVRAADYDEDEDGHVCAAGAVNSPECPDRDGLTDGAIGTLDCHDDPTVQQVEVDGTTLVSASAVHPGATDEWYDGVDHDCDGKNDFDQDFDGYVKSAFNQLAGGTAPNPGDCADEVAVVSVSDSSKTKAPGLVHPDAADKANDGIDQDCDKLNDFDDSAKPRARSALDGYVGDPYLAYAGAWDCLWPDGQVKSCNANKTDCLDAGTLVGLSVTIEARDISPAAEEAWYDEIDQDCDGKNDFDQDEDGYVKTMWNQYAGGSAPKKDDCDDRYPEGALVNKGQPETYYNGIDDDCDAVGTVDGDQDDDGYPCLVDSQAKACKPWEDQTYPTYDCYDCVDCAPASKVTSTATGLALDPGEIHPGIDELADNRCFNGVDDDCDGKAARLCHAGADPWAAGIGNWGSVPVAPPLPTSGTDVRRQLALSDLNNDGKLDLVVGDNGGTKVYVYLNAKLAAGDGSLKTVTKESYLLTRSTYSFVVDGDYDKDGKVDLAYISKDQTTVGVWWGDGTGNFSAGVGLGAWFAEDLVAVQDSDGNDKDELVVSDWDQGGYFRQVYVLEVGRTSSGSVAGLGITSFDDDVEPWLTSGSGFSDKPAQRLVVGGTDGGGHALKPLLPTLTNPVSLPLSGANENTLSLYTLGSDPGRPTVLKKLDYDGDGDMETPLVMSNPLWNSGAKLDTGMFVLDFLVSGDTDAPDVAFKADRSGDKSSSRCGVVVASGDLNGDEVGDLVFSRADASDSDKGSLYVHWGPVDVGGDYDCSDPGVLDLSYSGFWGDTASDGLGAYLAVGDVNNDGVDDLVYSVPGDNLPNGKTYIIAGGGL